MKKILQIICVTGLFGLTHLTQSQVSISGDLPQNYTQNFDSLGTASALWTNNVVLTGWHFVSSTNGAGSFDALGLATNNGSSFAGFWYNFGHPETPDRALGSVAGPFFGITFDHYYGAQFINNSSSPVTQVDISYTGEQWRDSTNLIQSLQFFYRVGGSDFVADLANIGWTPAPILNFVSVQNLGVGAIDGNNPANQSSIQGTLSGLNIPAGESFWIRWFDVNDGGDNVLDHGMAIDDVSVTFSTPLPGVSIDLKKPKTAKKLKFKTNKGFNIKGFISSETHPITKASYAAFGGTNTPTNVTFTTAGKFKPSKGKLAKKGIDFIFQSNKDTRAGVGIAAGASPVTLIIKIEGTVSNTPGIALFTNVFNNVVVK